MREREATLLRRLLEDDGHTIVALGRVRCPNPSHPDQHPSCQVYDDDRGGHAHCFSCGWHADAYTYLVTIRGLTPREALLIIGRDESSFSTWRSPRVRVSLPRETPPVRACEYAPLPGVVVDAHMARVRLVSALPKAIAARGFSAGDLLYLGIWVDREDAVFPIHGPDGAVVRLKRRFGKPSIQGMKYVYEPDGPKGGTPAWCSPGFGAAGVVLVTEGELNAMAMHLARPDLDVVGVAGVHGCLPIDQLRNREVVLYADGDVPGREAVRRWVNVLRSVAGWLGVLDPWPDGDACEVAGRLGRAALKKRLT